MISIGASFNEDFYEASVSFPEPVILKITPKSLNHLADILHARKIDSFYKGERENHDPFMYSPAYYAMTGRKGLWYYAQGQDEMIICAHPNKEGSYLLYYLGGKSFVTTLVSASQNLNIPLDKIQIARISTNDLTLLASQLPLLKAASPHEEDILDWRYPVHLINTAKLVNLQGSDLRNLRSHLRKAYGAGYHVMKINPDTHADVIWGIADQWARDGKKENYSYEDLTGPTGMLLSLMRQKNLGINGIVVFNDIEPIGFWIWEENPHGRIAISLARISIGQKGAAEFAGYKMAEYLASRGISYMCLGGSETESLDRFKRKLGPVRSVELKTVSFDDAWVDEQIAAFSQTAPFIAVSSQSVPEYQ